MKWLAIGVKMMATSSLMKWEEISPEWGWGSVWHNQSYASMETFEEHKYVLTQPCPSFPSLDAPLEEKQRYDRWQKSNEMAKCYILASISNVL